MSDERDRTSRILRAIGVEADRHVRIAQGAYRVCAATEDDVVHLAQMSVGRTWLSVMFRCRSLVVDEHGEALDHLRDPDTPVTCMACVVEP